MNKNAKGSKKTDHSEQMSSAIVETRRLRQVYQQGSRVISVLKGLDLKIARGKLTAIVGPSGAGKTTLLHIIGALQPPTSGEVFFDDEDVYRLKDKQRDRLRNRKIGFVFQFYHLLAELTARENVMVPALIAGEVQEAAVRAQDLLDRVGLADRADHKPAELSGGEQQRVAIARALMNRPSLLLCDEPTGNLDQESGAKIIDLLVRACRHEGCTVVVATHDTGLSSCADVVIHLKDGDIVSHEMPLQSALAGGTA